MSLTNNQITTLRESMLIACGAFRRACNAMGALNNDKFCASQFTKTDDLSLVYNVYTRMCRDIADLMALAREDVIRQFVIDELTYEDENCHRRTRNLYQEAERLLTPLVFQRDQSILAREFTFNMLCVLCNIWHYAQTRISEEL